MSDRQEELLRAAQEILEAAMVWGYVPRGRVRKAFYRVPTAALDALSKAVAKQGGCAMRSATYPTRYRVGSLNGADVYWQPGGGFALRRGAAEEAVLRGIPERELIGVDWFDRLEDFTAVSGAIARSGGRLADAMPAVLSWAFTVVQWAVEDAVVK